MKYTKLPLTYHQQVDLLQSRGLVISDKDYAVDLLKRIGYYRLTAYGLPFQSQKDIYDAKTKIEENWTDRKTGPVHYFFTFFLFCAKNKGVELLVHLRL